MKEEQGAREKSRPIIIETAGLRIWVDRRRGAVGDEGLTFDVSAAGRNDEEARILRFDCFTNRPHYHVGATAVHKMKDEGIESSVRWTLDQLKTRLRALVAEAGHEALAEKIDETAVARSLSRVEKEILAKIGAGVEPRQ